MNHTYEPIGEKRYNELVSARTFYLESARECCRYTLPVLEPFFIEGASPSWGSIRTPYQGIGARGVSNLASKLLMALTPSNTPMFRLTVDNDVLEQERTAIDPMWRDELEGSLTAYTESVLRCIKTSGDYAYMYEVWQLLLLSGNVLIVDPADNSNIKVYPLRDYCLKRDRSGNVIEVVLKETVSISALPDSKKVALPDLPSNEPLPSAKRSDDNIDIYTYLHRDGAFYYAHQECRGAVIEGTEAKYPLDGCPFIAVRMYSGASEDYSRSYVAAYLGDLKSADGLSQGAIEGSAMAAKHIYLVNPSGVTDIADIEDTPNGGVRYGRADDISVMQSNKSYDLRIVSEEESKIERRLAQAFLLFDGGVRDAERVTVAEIRAVATELESALGGVYSVMCHAFQAPYIRRKIWKLQALKKLTPLSKDITPVVVTGFEALGMGSDRDALIEYIMALRQVAGDDVAAQYINPVGVIKRLASSMHINPMGLIRSEEEVLQEQQNSAQAQQERQFMDKALAPAIGNAEGLASALGGIMPQQTEASVVE